MVRRGWFTFLAAASFSLVVLTGSIGATGAPEPVIPAGRAAAPTPNPANPGVIDIPDAELGTKYRQVIAISDVHGMYAACLQLLRASGVVEMAPAPVLKNGMPTGKYTWKPRWATDHTLFIVTGDSLDKGPQSLDVLKLWYDLHQTEQERDNRIVVLLGNHEAEYLASFLLTDPIEVEHLQEKRDDLTRELLGRGHTDDSLGDIGFHDAGYPLGQFLRDMPVAARVGQWAFCHAGWLPAQPGAAGTGWATFATSARTVLQQGRYDAPLLHDADSLLEKKTAGSGTQKWWKNPEEVARLEERLTKEYGLYGVVFGHQPNAFGIRDGVGCYRSEDCHLVKIDSGMAYADEPDEKEATAGAKTVMQPYRGHLLRFSHAADLRVAQKPALESVGFAPEARPAPVASGEP